MPKPAATPEKPLREELSLRAFARRIGVSHTAVGNAIRAGRLSASLVRRRGKILIEPAGAIAEWNANTDPSKQREPGERTGGVAPGTPPPNAGRPRPQPGLYGPELEAAAAKAGEQQPPKLGAGLQEIRRHHIAIQAQLSQIELEERQGKLVPANEVRAAAFNMAREVRNALVLLPNRLAPMLAAESDPHTIRQLLANEINQALEALSSTQPQTPAADEGARG